ncbi:4-coumarate--CoA ligase 1 [Trichoplax sp. H2]|nr:4-coumarate--CoA ligase 1 [Trichoplax sp. H2]|eukprot:RDD38269.1 4-coumarate--CoA ligase 1 [Trichoplax sp. H2]
MAEEHIISSPLSNVFIPSHLNIYQFFCENFDQYGDKPAITDAHSGLTLTYKMLKQQIRQCGSALRRAGFKKGDIFAIYSPNHPQYPVLIFAVAAIGGIVSTINPLFTAEEVIQQMKLSSAKYLLAHSSNAANAIKVDKTLNLRGLYVFGEEKGVTSFDTLIQDDGAFFKPDATIDPVNDVVMLPYSSGTTGIPKGVMLTHYNLIANFAQLIHPDVKVFDSDAPVLALLPFFHIYGLVVILLAGLRVGVHLISYLRFEPEVFLQSIEKYKIKYAPLVPPLYVFLAKTPLVEKYDLSSLQETMCGAAPLDYDLSQTVRKRVGLSLVRQVYGMTELSPLSHMGKRSDKDKLGAIGIVVPNTKAKVVDIETGRSLPEHQRGELCIRGPQVMKGYLRNKEATDRTIDKDGWLHTGDIAYYDKDGYFYVVDRLKELIKYKGHQVAPAELEALLLTNPKVADVAVIGRPDDDAGELPMAFIVRSGEITKQEIIDFVKDNVNPQKYLRGGVEFLDIIPKSASGKILRNQLRKRIKESTSLHSKL